MTDHDPLCNWYGDDEPPGDWCNCTMYDAVRADQDEKSRADEREQIANEGLSWVAERERGRWVKWLTDLHAKVEALPTRGLSAKVDVESREIVALPLVIRADVLDLLKDPKDQAPMRRADE